MAFELYQIANTEHILSQVWVDTDKRDAYEAALLLNEVYDRVVQKAGGAACGGPLTVELVFVDEQAPTPAAV